MEDARVKREQDEARARLEAERAAAEAAVRKAREEEEGRRRAEEERLRRIEDEKQSRLREDQVRVEEAERRARVEGELKLQEERMRLEIQSRASGGRSPVKAVVASVVLVALVGGVLLYRMNTQHREEQAVALRERQIAEEKAKVREAEFVAQLGAIKREMDEKMKLAKNEAERAKIRADAEAKKADVELRASNSGHRKQTGRSDTPTPGTKAPKYKDPGKRDINDDILNGL